MTIRSAAELKALFETGDFPDGAAFSDLIDSMLHVSLDNFPQTLPAASGENLYGVQQAVTVEAWANVAEPVGFLDANTVVLTGNVPSKFPAGIRVRLTLGSGFVYTSASAASYNGGTNVTTLDLVDAVADGTISDIDVSIFVPVANGGAVGLGTLGVSAFAATLLDDADPAAGRATLGVGAATTAAAGLARLATTAEAIAGTDATIAATPAGLGAYWSTGDAKLTWKTAPDTGWIMANDGSIGDATSGATNRANADTAALYALLWAGCSNAVAPVAGGRGANAAADFAAHKALTLPRHLGRSLSVAGTGSGLSARALGEFVGAETYALGQGNLPNTNFTVTVNGATIHVFDLGATSADTDNLGPMSASGLAGSHATTAVAASGGSAQPFSIIDPRVHLNVMIKL